MEVGHGGAVDHRQRGVRRLLVRKPLPESRAGPPDGKAAGKADTRGEVLPTVILFMGVMWTILMGVHVVVMAMARTTAQAAVIAAVNAAQNAAPGSRESEGVLAARIALAAASSTAVETRPPAVTVEPGLGQVRALVFAGTLSPIFGGVEISALACGPLDDITSAPTSAEAWRC